MVTGFLGSGKSTFLRNFHFFFPPKAHCRWNRGETGLSLGIPSAPCRETRNTAVVINERGRFLLEGEKKKKFDPYKPDRGETTEEDENYFFRSDPASIFSQENSLYKIVNQLIRENYERIIVETSGLIQPALLNRLVRTLVKLNQRTICYRGMICIIDTLRFLKLFSTAVPVYEQAAYADSFVLSKTDLAEREEVEKIKKLLKTLRPMAPIFLGEWPA